MKTTEQKIKIMQEFESGKQIEFRLIDSPSDSWQDCLVPSWNWQKFYYRVKKTHKQNLTYLYRQWKASNKSKSTIEIKLVKMLKKSNDEMTECLLDVLKHVCLSSSMFEKIGKFVGIDENSTAKQVEDILK